MDSSHQLIGRIKVESVRKALPDAVIYLAEIDQEIVGFAGVIDQFIAGIFVKRNTGNKESVRN